MKKVILGLVALLCLSRCELGGGAGTPKSDEQKAVYAIGFDMGSKLQALSLTDEERKFLEAGLKDGLTNQKARLEMKEAFPLITNMIRTRNEKTRDQEGKESIQFLEKKSKEEGVVKLDSGMYMKTLKEGTGPSPKPEDRVKVHYHGTLRDGKVFDSSRDRGEPATFGLNQVIKCWTEGVQKMKVGGKAILYCPSELAYGTSGAGPDIKPGAALTFEIELIEILGPEAAQAPAPAPGKAAGKEEAKKKESKKETKK